MLTKKGDLVDLRGIWASKSELLACEYALFSLSHLCYLIDVQILPLAARLIRNDGRPPIFEQSSKKVMVGANGKRRKK